MVEKRRKGGQGSPDPVSQGEAQEEAFIYKVAELAWKDGLAPNSIAKQLGIPAEIMRVKRALVKAVNRQVLVLKPRLLGDCKDRLKEVTHDKLRDYVIVDDQKFSDGTAVCLAGAEMIARLIDELLQARKKKEVVVGIAGGTTVWQAVEYLPRIAPRVQFEGPAPPELTFLALNSAGRRRSFNESSNFLAVRLAEIYKGRHIAVLSHTDMAVESEYRTKVNNIDLLICGAGALDSLLCEHVKEWKVDLPPEMVGDFCLIPLDEAGRPVDNDPLNKVLASLNRHPAYSEVQAIAHDPHKFALVLFHTRKPSSKVKIAHAILSRGLASHCVIGISLASLVIDSYAKAPP